MRAAIAIAASAVAAGSNMPFDVSWIGNAALPTAWNTPDQWSPAGAVPLPCATVTVPALVEVSSAEGVDFATITADGTIVIENDGSLAITGGGTVETCCDGLSNYKLDLANRQCVAKAAPTDAEKETHTSKCTLTITYAGLVDFTPSVKNACEKSVAAEAGDNVHTSMVTCEVAAGGRRLGAADGVWNGEVDVTIEGEDATIVAAEAALDVMSDTTSTEGAAAQDQYVELMNDYLEQEAAASNAILEQQATDNGSAYVPVAAQTTTGTACTPPVAETGSPTAYPTAYPTASPTKAPTAYPTAYPTASPTKAPTAYPTASPTKAPTAYPTAYPTASPTKAPTAYPTPYPTPFPTPACTPGSFGVGGHTCVECPAGKYSDVYNQEECAICDPGQHAVKRSTHCTDCAVGKFHPSSHSSCLDCDQGQYAEAEKATMCEHCEAGKYQSKIGIHECHLCHEGRFSVAVGRKTVCTQCAEGTFQNEAGQLECKQCNAGQFGTPGLTGGIGRDSTQTYSGTHGEEGNSTHVTNELLNVAGVCTACPVGQFQTAPAIVSCQDCAIGRFNAATGRNTTCENCVAGQYQPVTEQTSCVHCTVGKFGITAAPTTAEAHCTSCPVGQWQDATAETSCTACLVGRYVAVKGWSSSAGCKLCPNGKYQTATTQSSCTNCTIGQFGAIGVSEASAENHCSDCVKGKFQDQEAQVSCIECALGQHQNAVEQTSCIECAHGKYAPAKAREWCTACASGKFGTPDELGASVEDATAGGHCTQCPAGKFQTTEANTDCDDCQVGRFSVAIQRNTTCTFCPGGKYQGAKESTSCINCAVGRFGSSTEQATAIVHCTDCPVGKYQGAEHQIACTQCAAGSFQNSAAQASCTLCVSGKFQDNVEQVSCAECRKGRFHEHGEDGASNHTSHCNFCPNGRFQPSEGSLVCLSCPDGKFSNNFAADVNDVWTDHVAGHGELAFEVCKVCKTETPAPDLRKWWTEGNAGWSRCTKHPLDCERGSYGQYDTCTKSCKSNNMAVQPLDHLVANPTGLVLMSDTASWSPFGYYMQQASPSWHAWGGEEASGAPRPDHAPITCSDVSFQDHKGYPSTDVYSGMVDDFLFEKTIWNQATDKWERTSRCNTHQCPIDCQISPWTLWDACTKTCGEGDTTKTRTVVVSTQFGGKVCPTLTANKPCNPHKCINEICHVKHVTCKLNYVQYGRATSCVNAMKTKLNVSGHNVTYYQDCHKCDTALECAAKNIVRTISVTSHKQYAHVKSKYHCKIVDATAEDEAKVDAYWLTQDKPVNHFINGHRVTHKHMMPEAESTCQCRCDSHPIACYRKNFKLSNGYIHGSIYKDVDSVQKCSDLCTHHPLCTTWEFDSTDTCTLKQGTASYTENTDTSITTYAGIKSKTSACLMPRPKLCPFGKYQFMDDSTDLEYCLACPEGKYTKVGYNQQECFDKADAEATLGTGIVWPTAEQVHNVTGLKPLPSQPVPQTPTIADEQFGGPGEEESISFTHF